MDPRRILVLLLAAVALASTYLALAPIVEQAGSATSSKELNPYEIQGDKFSNYDFLSKTYSRENVDWAVDLIFAHGGSVNRVKSQLDDPFHQSRTKIDPPGADPVDIGPSPMQMWLNDGGGIEGWEWDEDAGRKTHLCETQDEPNVFHYRIYAPKDTDHFVNQKWGNYSVATAHIDHNECTGGWAGKSEAAERMVAYHSTRVFEKARVFPDKVWLRNFELSAKLVHWWVNDGKATFINVTGK
ncbi:MAG TPA: hypothetical protein VGV69_08565 [Solirubrobacterales bacterium]|nr:hypothetical protein [Solirubrobacterales bacterium]